MIERVFGWTFLALAFVLLGCSAYAFFVGIWRSGLGGVLGVCFLLLFSAMAFESKEARHAD